MSALLHLLTFCFIGSTDKNCCSKAISCLTAYRTIQERCFVRRVSPISSDILYVPLIFSEGVIHFSCGCWCPMTFVILFFKKYHVIKVPFSSVTSFYGMMWQSVLHVVRIGHWQVRIRSTAVGMFELLSLSSTMIHTPITTEYSMNPLPLNRL